MTALGALLAEDGEWWVAGDPAILPWAGSFRGPAGFEQWRGALTGALDYQRFEIVETIDGGETFVEIIEAAGVARSTGRPFASRVARTFTERGGKLVRVCSFYDTAAYEKAVAPKP